MNLTTMNVAMSAVSNVAMPRQALSKSRVSFGNDSPNGTPAQKEFFARLKGIAVSLDEGSLKVIEARLPYVEKDEYFDEATITGVLEKADGQRFTFKMSGNMSGRSFCLENQTLGIKYDYSRQCGKVSVKAYDRRAGKQFDYHVEDFDTIRTRGTAMDQVAEQATLTRKALLNAVKAFHDNPPVSLTDVPTNRDF